MFGLKTGRVGALTIFRQDGDDSASTWTRVQGGSTHRFGIVLAPPRQGASPTLSLMVELSANWQPYNVCVDSPPERISMSFDGVAISQ